LPSKGKITMRFDLDKYKEIKKAALDKAKVIYDPSKRPDYSQKPVKRVIKRGGCGCGGRKRKHG